MCLSMPSIFWNPKVLRMLGSKIILLHNLNAFFIQLKCRTTYSLLLNHIPFQNLIFSNQLNLRMALSSLPVIIATSSAQMPYWNLQTNFTFSPFFNDLSNLLRGRKDIYQGVFIRFSPPLSNQVNSLKGLLGVLFYFFGDMLLFMYVSSKTPGTKDLLPHV